MQVKRIIAIILGLTLLCSSTGPGFVRASSNDTAHVSDGSNDLESALAEQKAQNARELAAARAELAAYQSQSNSVRAQLDLLLEEDAATLEEYERLSSELDMAMDAVEHSVRLYEDAQLAADEMQTLYEERITTLFKYRNRSLLEIFFASDSIDGFFTNLRLMSFIASADQRMLLDLKLAREDAAIARAKAEDVAGQAEIYFEYVNEQLSRLKNDIDLIESDLASLEQAILNRSAGLEALESEGDLINKELMEYYAEMAKLQEAAQASLTAESSARETTVEPKSADMEESLSVPGTGLPLPTPAVTSETQVSQGNTGAGSSAATTSDRSSTGSPTSTSRPTATERQTTTTRSTTERQTTTTERVSTTERQTTTTTQRQTTSERPATTELVTTTTRPATTQAPMTSTVKTTTSTSTTATTTAPPATTPPPATDAPPPSQGSSQYFMFPLVSYQNDNSSYGPRVHPITGAVNAFHYGSDFSAPAGTPIRASMDGTVILVDKTWQGQTYTTHNTGYGNFVTIQHANGISTTYAHMKFVTVEIGQQVKQGDFIGQVGSTGASTGPHLHFEIAIYGSTVNPMGSQYLGSPHAIR